MSCTVCEISQIENCICVCVCVYVCVCVCVCVCTHTVEPGYNDIGLCDTSSVASDILWYQLISRC
jgi:hypothetical protein